ncbi:hypothetical protein [Methanosphaera sp.]|jgi:hypothetical protein|uniref:hypothetical protein n=1 Tax=Methanosphaera sp. TaxID=2666342 RepID=UPI003D8DBA3F
MFGKKLEVTHKIHSGMDTIKKSLDYTLKPQSYKKDKKLAGYIYPLVNIHDCKQVIDNYPILNAVIRVLSADITLNEFNFYIQNDPYNIFNSVDSFWIDNKAELSKAVEQYLGYGFGACEILMEQDNPSKPVKLLQIPSETLLIKVQKFNDQIYHYAYYQYNNDKKIFRITRENYDNITMEEDHSVGYIIWLGGGTESNWYTKPYWTSCYLDILTSIKKKELDYAVLRDGNIPKAALFIKAPPSNNQDNEMGMYEALQQQFRNSGGGVAISYLETPMNDTTLTTEYVNLQADNYDYLNELIDRTDNLIFTSYRVPKVRLMIDDTKESLNSNKSETLYEIYTLDLETYQYPLEDEINIFNELFFGLEATCDIRTPVFTDTKATQVDTIVSLFSVGIISLKQAISMVAALYPNEDWSDVDFNDPLMWQRFYHGMLFITPGVQTGMDDLQQDDLRGGYGNQIKYNPEATPEEQHLYQRAVWGRQ